MDVVLTFPRATPIDSSAWGRGEYLSPFLAVWMEFGHRPTAQKFTLHAIYVFVECTQIYIKYIYICQL